VHLNEIARVYDGVENDKSASWVVDTRSIYLAIQRQPARTPWPVVDAVRALLPELRTQLPASGQPDHPQRSLAIDSRLRARREVHAPPHRRARRPRHLLFLRNLSATLIPSLALPASIVGTSARCTC
jgi:HAE1 family hydrophobic/amphiphilic exporter-1